MKIPTEYDEIPPCLNCKGEGVIHCLTLPPVECDVCLGLKKDWSVLEPTCGGDNSRALAAMIRMRKKGKI